MAARAAPARTQDEPLRRALQAWLDEAARRPDPVEATRAAAEALAAQPWEVVAIGGALARATMQRPSVDIGINNKLEWISPEDPRALVRAPRGAPCPQLDLAHRRALGAFDTPRTLAREVVGLALAAATRPVRRGLDPACGSGAFLVALQERGVEATGVELEPATAAVARVAAPGATIHLADSLRWSPEETVDLVVGNPPFVPPERQDRATREALQRSMPWLSGRFDLAVPFAARAAELVAPGGGLCLVLPAPLLCQPYALPLRRRWAASHRITSLLSGGRFPGASVNVSLVALRIGDGPAPFPDHQLSYEEWTRLESGPWNPELRPGDVDLMERVRSRSLPLGELCEIDTGVVAHGADGPKARLLSDAPGPGLLPYVDARDLTRGQPRWLDYAPQRMHRPKRLDLFQADKLLIQRLWGRGAPRVWLDRQGLIAGHTLNVARPLSARVPLERLFDLLRSPEAAGLARLVAGPRLDLYPHQLALWPVPRRWLDEPDAPLQQAWGLSDAEFLRLNALAHDLGPGPGAEAVAPDPAGR